MKLFFLAILTSFSIGAFAVQLDGPVSGSVVCSMTAPKITGFEGVNVRGKFRPYVGVTEIGNLNVTVEYNSKYGAFDIKVAELDEDGEETAQILKASTTLFAGTFWHSKTAHKDFNLELNCHFQPSK